VQDGPPPPLHPVLVLVQRRETAVAVRSTTTDPLEVAVLHALRCRNAVAAPIRRGGLIIGALVVADRSDRTLDFSDHDAELAGSLAAAATVALDKGQLFDRVRQEAAVREHQALHDALTGLPNRALVTRQLQSALLHGEVGVLLLDLDRFQDVNDSLGHDVGDTLLLKVAARLRDRLAPRFAETGGWLGRLGGDEFAVVLLGLSHEALAMEAEVVLSVFEKPFTVGDMLLDVRGSVGAACRTHADQAGRLMQYAEIAMYDVKRRGGGANVYLKGDEHHSRRRLALAGALRRAVENGDLTVSYQPKVDLLTGRPIGVEALVRWTSPEHGIVGPDEFVPLAEQSGLVGALTALVLDKALERAAAWAAAGRDLTVAVNVSPRGLADGSLVEDVPMMLARHGVPAHRLILELTEGTVMSDPAASVEVLDRLAALGVGLSIDDFGTGYSSLAYLKRLPVDEVKIDRAFVMGMAGDGDDAAIVRSTVHLAHDLGLKVVAEGVEDAVAYAGLQALGCDVAQGYLLSRPLTADALEDWLDAWPGHGSALLGAPPQRVPEPVDRPA
jgi:diguanylate cyclase (GGDEF)-like protein